MEEHDELNYPQLKSKQNKSAILTSTVFRLVQNNLSQLVGIKFLQKSLTAKFTFNYVSRE